MNNPLRVYVIQNNFKETFVLKNTFLDKYKLDSIPNTVPNKLAKEQCLISLTDTDRR